MKNNTYYLDMFLEDLVTDHGVKIFRLKDKIIIKHPEEVAWLQPDIIIKDAQSLEKTLAEYIKTTKSQNIKSVTYNERHDERYFLGSLIKNLTNSDYQDFERYVKRTTSFLKDESFSNYDQTTLVGSLDDKNSIYVKRSQEYYAMETPYILKMTVKNKNISYDLPLIRYGVEVSSDGEKTAYIYAIQRKRQYAPNPHIDEIEKTFRAINSSVKTNRDIAPSMLVVFGIFVGLAKSEGINTIKFADFINRRYFHFRDVKDETDRDRIQTNATDKLLKIGIRANDQIEGLDIIAYPQDVDNFMHIKLGDNLTSKKPYLNNILKISLQKTKESNNAQNDDRQK